MLQRWRGLALVLAACALTLAAVTPRADAQGAEKGAEAIVKAPQAILMDADTGAIMFQRNADQLMHPASMSKLMLLAIMFKALKAGEIKLTDEYRMSENAWRRGGAPSGTSAMFVPIGTKATIDELLKGIIVQSGNDAAISVAENMFGSEQAGARYMTEEAGNLGLRKSRFMNATGLHDPLHVMSARDLAMLARHVIKEYPEYYPLFAQREFHYRRHKFFNRNPLLTVVPGVDGLKTGFIKEAGYGITASAKQDNRRLIVVVNGLGTAEERRDDARRLFEWGFRNFSEAKLFDAGEVVGHARVWGGSRMFAPLVGSGEVSIVLPRHPPNQKLTARIYYKGPLKPPLKKGEQVAVLRVTTSTEAMNEIPLYVAEDVGVGGVMRRGLDSLWHLATRWMP